VKWVLVKLVLLYRATLGPLLGGHCKYTPTCSQYALDALHKHGAWRGFWMTTWRLLRCAPWSRGGYDPP
jgi:uncharacterized protein